MVQLPNHFMNKNIFYFSLHLNIILGDTDLENGLVDSRGEEEGKTNWESNIDTHTHTHIYIWTYIYIVLCKIDNWREAAV